MATREEIDKILMLATGKMGIHLDAFKQELSDLGVVIKVDRELPKPPQEPLVKMGNATGWGRFKTGSPEEVWKMALEAIEGAGYVATEPLIEENVMATREEIREGFKDFICRLAKSDGDDACESCEKLELKPVCSIRHNANEYLTHLHSQGVVIKVDGHLSDCAVYNMPAYPNGPCDCKDRIPAGYVAVIPLIEVKE